MPSGIHTNPDCQCACCKAKRGEYKGINNPSYGKRGGHTNKGMHWKNSDKFGKKQSERMKGANHWNYGNIATEETRKLISESHKGYKNHNWKGKEYQNKAGRWLIWIDGKRIVRARYIAEQCLGRELTKDECVHHINEDKKVMIVQKIYMFFQVLLNIQDITK